ncbi:MAG: hypothetical protein QOC83_7105, partial [Pseudonocardiales bacterium]|nr:hypothetical protein [Pseudonocardiales bacterium]
GVMLQAVFLDRTTATGQPAPGRLVLAAHHLVVDGVSWRILIEDLATAWTQIHAGDSIELAAVPTSFRTWAQALVAESRSERRLAELEHWHDVLSQESVAVSIGRRPLQPGDTCARSRSLQVSLPAEVTTRVLGTVPAAFHGSVNDVLLCALALAIRPSEHDGSGVVIDLEGHGREADAVGDVDLTRTVGWFTNIAPVALDPGPVTWDAFLMGGPPMCEALKRVKEQLAGVPGGGLGYGLLRWLNPQAAPELRAAREPEILFNYLGRFSAGDGSETAAWEMAPETPSLGERADPSAPAGYALEINASVSDGGAGPQLTAELSWPDGVLAEAEARTIGERWTVALSALAEHAPAPGLWGHSPSDFPLVDVRQEDVDVLHERVAGLADVWSLTPLQHGMYFHSRYHDQTAADPDGYIVQYVVDLEGDVERARLQEAVQALVARHATLRAAFHESDDGRILQSVARSVQVPLRWVEVTATGIAAQRDEIADVTASERAAPLALDAAPLLRVACVRCGPGEHALVLTIHHLVADGWSIPILFDDLVALYRARGSARDLSPISSYREYLRWLADRDRAATRAVWERALSGVGEPTLLGAVGADAAPAPPRALEHAVAAADTAAIAALARARGLTMNTVVQGAWALAVGVVTGRDDVVFGAAVSGRDAGVTGIDEQVGLFINTVPVRVRWSPSETIAEVLARHQQEQSELLGHQYLGVSEIKSMIGAGELFDALFVFENFPVGAGTVGGDDELRIAGVRESLEARTHFAVSLQAFPGDELSLRLQYDDRRVDDDRAERLLETLLSILDQAVIDAERLVGRLETTGRAERAALEGWWAGSVRGCSELSVADVLEVRAGRSP